MRSNNRYTPLIAVAAIILTCSPSFAAEIIIPLSPAPGVTDGSGIKIESDQFFSSSGTGVYGDVFLRMQANGTESGFNTSGTVALDTVAGSHTHDVLFANLLASGGFYQISLDINQVGNADTTPVASNILLTSFDVYRHNTPNITLAQLSLLSPVLSLVDDYRLPRLNSGSGDGDVQFFLPTGGLLAGSGAYFTLRASFSSTDDGFEEFTAVTGVAPPVPDNGSTLALFGCSMLFLGICRRHHLKRKSPSVV